MKQIINWALVGTGGISRKFAEGLRSAEGASIYAAVSRSAEEAAKAAAAWGAAKSYSRLDAALDDKNVDIVYLGVPHVFHTTLALRALAAGKAVLVEKPAALNAREAALMINAAREAKCFLMEALWARFTPAAAQVRAWLASGAIGEPRLARAVFGFTAPADPAGRLRNPALGGGALLDAGIYPLSFVSQVFGPAEPQTITSVLTLGSTGVDEETSALLAWGAHKQASIATSLSVPLGSEAAIYGTRGVIRLPSCVWVKDAALFTGGADSPSERWQGETRGNGYNYEAEAAMESLRYGQTENPLMPLDETLALARTMDEIRRQAHFTYPGE